MKTLLTLILTLLSSIALAETWNNVDEYLDHNLQDEFTITDYSMFKREKVMIGKYQHTMNGPLKSWDNFPAVTVAFHKPVMFYDREVFLDEDGNVVSNEEGRDPYSDRYIMNNIVENRAFSTNTTAEKIIQYYKDIKHDLSSVESTKFKKQYIEYMEQKAGVYFNGQVIITEQFAAKDIFNPGWDVVMDSEYKVKQLIPRTNRVMKKTPEMVQSLGRRLEGFTEKSVERLETIIRQNLQAGHHQYALGLLSLHYKMMFDAKHENKTLKPSPELMLEEMPFLKELVLNDVIENNGMTPEEVLERLGTISDEVSEFEYDYWHDHLMVIYHVLQNNEEA